MRHLSPEDTEVKLLLMELEIKSLLVLLGVVRLGYSGVGWEKRGIEAPGKVFGVLGGVDLF